MPVLIQERLRVALVIVFLSPGGARLGSPSRCRRVPGTFDVPPTVVAYLARSFSLAEAGVALLIVFSQTAQSIHAGASDQRASQKLTLQLDGRTDTMREAG